MTIDTLWKDNPISCTNTFGKLNCTLCMKERLHMLKALEDEEKTRLINSNKELYGTCRHNLKFHRYTYYTISTDDGQLGPERVIMDSGKTPHINSTKSSNRGLLLYRRINNAPQKGNPPL